MTERTPLERLLADWMAAEADVAPAGLVDELLSETRRRRPAPRWLALLAERPLRVRRRPAVGLAHRGLVLAAAVAALLLLAFAAVAAGAHLLQHPALPTADEWTMFRGDATHAATALHGPVGRPVVRWTYHAGGAVSDDIAIVGGLAYFSTGDGVLHAVRANDGVEAWRVSVAPDVPSGPTVAGGVVIVDDVARDETGVIRAFDAASGAERWRSSTRLRGPSTAVAADGAVYVATSDGLLVALDAATGEGRWSTRLPGPSATVQPPAVAAGLVYTVVSPGGLYAVDTATGAIRWRLDTGPDPLGLPAVAGVIAYVGAPADAAAGRLRAVDALTGQARWQVDEPLFAPTLGDGLGFTGSTLGIATALDPGSGAERWRVTYPRGYTPAPVEANGIVYVAANGGRRLYALDAASGRQLWQFDLDAPTECCVAVAGRSIFVGTANGTVYDIGGDGSALAPPQPAPPSSSSPVTAPPTASAASAPALSASAAPVAAAFAGKSLGPDGFAPAWLALAPDGTLWASDVTHDRFGLFSRAGSFIGFWGSSGSGPGELRLSRSNGDTYGQVAFEPDGSFFVLDPGNHRVEEFDARRRLLGQWGEFGTGPGQYSDPVGIAVARDGTVWVLDDVRGVAEHYDRSGLVLGSVDAFSNTMPGFSKANSLSVDSAGDLFVSQIDPNEVAEFDPTGKLLATFGGSGPGQFGAQPQGMAVDSAGRLFVGQGPMSDPGLGVEAFDAAGQYLGGWGPFGSAVGQLLFPTGLALDGAGHVYVADQADQSGGVGTAGVVRFSLDPPWGR